MKLVLASTSPFRKAILEKLGVPFEIQSPSVDETPLSDETPAQLVERLAIAKASAIAGQRDRGLVIGSDQVAVIDDHILGKPGNHEKAVQQLQQAAGKRVVFQTGLALVNAATGHVQSEVVPFTVVFRPLGAQQIENYLQREQPYNCAGSFKSEGLGIALFEKLEGDDPNTLMGLPLIRLIRMLEKEGLTII
ncbi:MAG: Maf-like protein [Proteobacteria bacterium]|jgi:septum formation protein|nr:Maf-like protein [Pseudomonadota bacterium]MCG6936439.1 Maf-like protein [Pseudomonadota bacterium]